MVSGFSSCWNFDRLDLTWVLCVSSLPSSPPHPSALTIFLFPLPQCPLSLGCGRLMSMSCLWLATQSHLFSTLWPVLVLFIDYYCKRKLLWPRLRAAQIYEYKCKYLEGSLTSWSFRRHIGSLLGPMTSPDMLFNRLIRPGMKSLLQSRPPIHLEGRWLSPSWLLFFAMMEHRTKATYRRVSWASSSRGIRVHHRGEAWQQSGMAA